MEVEPEVARTELALALASEELMPEAAVKMSNPQVESSCPRATGRAAGGGVSCRLEVPRRAARRLEGLRRAASAI